MASSTTNRPTVGELTLQQMQDPRVSELTIVNSALEKALATLGYKIKGPGKPT